MEKELSDYKRTEDPLSETDGYYRVIAETATDAIISIDDTSNILFANRASERIFGYTIDELVGQSLTILIPESLRDRHRNNRVVRRKGRVYVINKTNRRFKARQG